VCMFVYASGPICPCVYYLICYEDRKPDVVNVFNLRVLINTYWLQTEFDKKGMGGQYKWG